MEIVNDKLVLKPTYKLFPEPTDEDRKNGWTYSYDYIQDIADVSQNCCEFTADLEEVNAILIVIESMVDKDGKPTALPNDGGC